MIYGTTAFWSALVERAIKTAAQTLIALIGVEQVGILQLDWPQLLSVTGTATLLSILTSIASGPIGTPGPGLASETVAPFIDPPADEADYVPADEADYVPDDEADYVPADEADYAPAEEYHAKH